MAHTNPTIGQSDWGDELNQALDDIDNTAIAAQTTADGKADAAHDHDSDYVALTGDQSIAGVKTFTSSPLVPTPAAGENDRAANRGYVDTGLAGKANTSHSHAGTDITSGTVAFARLPTGTTSSTVSVGDHTHDTRYYTETEVDTALSGKASTSHSHAGTDITSGTVAFARLPTGTGSTQVAAGDHTHDARYYTETETNSLLAGKSDTTHLHAGQDIEPDTIDLEGAGDVVLSRLAANQLNLVGSYQSDRASATDPAYLAKQTGDTINRFQMRANGEMTWGPGGSTARDVTLERSASGRLTVTGDLHVTGSVTCGTKAFQADSTTFTVSGTSFGNGTTNCGTAFVAGASGMAKVTVGGLVRTADTTGSSTCFMSTRIGTGSTVGGGTLVLDSLTDASLRAEKDTTTESTFVGVMGSYVRVVTGLTPGDTYNVIVQTRMSNANDGLVTERRVFVEPW